MVPATVPPTRGLGQIPNFVALLERSRSRFSLFLIVDAHAPRDRSKPTAAQD